MTLQFKTPIKISLSSALLLSVSAGSLQSQSAMTPSIGMFGTTGLIDMPSAESQQDAEFNTTLSAFSDFTRGTFTFQVTPRLSASFRYSKLDNWALGGPITQPEYFDRSFDLQYRLVDEKKFVPAVAVGLRDFMGTGVYSSQYVVATKNVSPKLKLTGGIGWGRLSDSDDFTPPDVGLGGTPNVGDWFKGTPGAFGGLEWQTPVEGLRFKAEYSSDKYVLENELITTDGQNRVRTAASFERKSPLNFGLEYKTKAGLQYGLYYLYGSEVGVSFSTALNPKRGRSIVDRAPTPIAARDAGYSRDTAWTQIDGIDAVAREQLVKELSKDKIRLEALHFSGVHAEVRVQNRKYLQASQAVGRTSRALAKVFPDSVESFTIVLVENGLSTSAITVQRRDLEKLEHHVDGVRLMASRVDISNAEAVPEGASFADDLYPKLSWKIAPFAGFKLFNASDPFALTAGIRASAKYQITPGLSVSGAIAKKLINGTSSANLSDGALPPVRTNVSLYNIVEKPVLENLTADYVFKLAPSVFGRVSAGYFESMFGGVSSEILWKDAEKNWGLGAEVNYVKQREFEQRFGFQDYTVATGHVSAYFEMNGGFDVQLDVGRYLAGDVGATLSVDRTFDNGWKLGGYATVTNVSSEDFGEGRFDKGVRLEVPIGWALGTPSKSTLKASIASLTRDGGARLKVNNRLYETVRDTHGRKLSGSWGRFWQ